MSATAYAIAGKVIDLYPDVNMAESAMRAELEPMIEREIASDPRVQAYEKMSNTVGAGQRVVAIAVGSFVLGSIFGGVVAGIF